MAKMRVHQLAKELNISSKILIQKAQAWGYSDIKSHANSLDDSVADELRKRFKSGDSGKPRTPKNKTVLRRRTKQSSDGSGYKVITTRLSGESSEVIESKSIELPIIPEIPIPTPSTTETQKTTPPTPSTTNIKTSSQSPLEESKEPKEAKAAPEPKEAKATPEPKEAKATQKAPDQKDIQPSSHEDGQKKKIQEASEVKTTSRTSETEQEEEVSVKSIEPSKKEAKKSTEKATPSEILEEKVAQKSPSTDLKKEKKKEPKSSSRQAQASNKSEKTSKKASPQEGQLTPQQDSSKKVKQKEQTAPNKKEPKKSKAASSQETTGQPSQKEEAPISKKQKKKKKNKEQKRAQNLHITPKFESDITLKAQKLAEKEEKSQEVINDKDKFSEKEILPTRGQRQKQRHAEEMGRHSKSSSRKQRSEQQGNRNARKKNKKDRRQQAAKEKQKPTINPPSMKKKMIKVDEAISVAELAHKMGVKASEIIAKLMRQGVLVTMNEAISVDLATQVARDFGYEVQNITFQEEELLKAEPEELDEQNAQPRAPIITVMGHVDHGKTSLLDAIRKTNVAAREAGGITQHIGASVVDLPEGRLVFLDTPGHEAFTAMRARGAQATDIVILVVAADDGVMPQTEEAIQHAQAANVPIVVAVNKIDKPGADSSKVRLELMKYNLVAEEYGGDVLMVDVSAHTKQGIPELLEAVLLQAELMELKANPNKRANGIVIEARQEKGRGPVATVLIQEGTLSINDAIVVGTHYGKVRAMLDHNNKPIKKAGPSTPVRILGLSGLPLPGEQLNSVSDEKAAKQIAEHRFQQQQQQKLSGKPKRSTFEDLWNQQDKKKVLNIILKADVQGTLEALKESLLKLKTDEIETNIQLANVGGITESDVNLATTTNAFIIGFQVRADNKAQRLAESEGVELKTYRVIYELINDVKAIMQKQLAPTIQEKPIGQATIRKVFTIPKVGKVAGCYVTEGKITRNSLMRLYRNNIQIYEGKIASLRRFKNDAKEVPSGYECGIQIEGYQDIRDGDLIEAYELEEVAPVLNLD